MTCYTGRCLLVPLYSCWITNVLLHKPTRTHKWTNTHIRILVFFIKKKRSVIPGHLIPILFVSSSFSRLTHPPPPPYPSSSISQMSLQSNADFRLLNKFLPVTHDFWHHVPICNFAYINICLYTVTPSVFGRPLRRLPWGLFLNTWLAFSLSLSLSLSSCAKHSTKYAQFGDSLEARNPVSDVVRCLPPANVNQLISKQQLITLIVYISFCILTQPHESFIAAVKASNSSQIHLYKKKKRSPFHGSERYCGKKRRKKSAE